MAESLSNFVTHDIIKELRGDIEGKANSSEIRILKDENEIIRKNMGSGASIHDIEKRVQILKSDIEGKIVNFTSKNTFKRVMS